jgi:hypothetical protein
VALPLLAPAAAAALLALAPATCASLLPRPLLALPLLLLLHSSLSSLYRSSGS